MAQRLTMRAGAQWSARSGGLANRVKRTACNREGCQMAATEAGSARRRCNRSALTSTNTVGPAGIEPATRGLKVACAGERGSWSEGGKRV